MRVAIVVGLCLAAVPALASDKESPDYLRLRHAGVVGMESSKPVGELYPILLEAARQCWVGLIAPGAGTGVAGGAVGAMSSAQRVVTGAQASDGNTAVVDVQVRGFFGATKMNFLQIDLARRVTGSHVEVYYRNNVALQRQFPEQVRAWIAGDTVNCDPKIQRGIVQ